MMNHDLYERVFIQVYERKMTFHAEVTLDNERPEQIDWVNGFCPRYYSAV